MLETRTVDAEATKAGTRPLEVVRLGLVEYEDGLDLMARLTGPVASGALPEQLLLLQHPPVVTLGRNAKDLHLLQSPEALAARDIGFFRTGRGGDVTYHGPGQIVGYPILDLNKGVRDVRRYVRDLEEVIIRTLADFGVASGRIAGLTGVWVGDLKVCAIGVRISRWITSHGFAFNVSTDLSGFDVMIPCGIHEHGVTSLAKLVGHDVSADDVGTRLARRFGEVFEREIAELSVETRSVQVWVWRRGTEGPEVLVLKRSARDGGFWQPVTGLVEPGEDPALAARREVIEETGVAGEPRDLDFVRDFAIEPVGTAVRPRGPRPWLDREFAFELETNAPSIRLSEGEHDEYLWTTIDRAKELLRWKGNQRALARLAPPRGDDAPLVVRGMPAEQVAPAPAGAAARGRSPFPVLNGGEIGTTPRSRGHRTAEPRRPDWLKIQITTGDAFQHVRRMTEELKLNTVCQEARCPNIYECWSDRTATFMILGDTCTRHCTFCAISRAKEGRPLDPQEPRHVAEAIARLGLAHAVITSVNRDELPDGGSVHFAETIREARRLNPECRIEVLIPDFCGNWEALETVLAAEPHVLNHNTETVERLYSRVRPDARYAQSMELLERASREKIRRPELLTKSGLMLGLGETKSEVLRTLRDLRAVHVDIVTMGQYLSPSKKHLGVEKYWRPEEFDELRIEGLALGFRFVEAGPLVRSSYHARRHADGAS